MKRSPTPEPPPHPYRAVGHLERAYMLLAEAEESLEKAKRSVLANSGAGWAQQAIASTGIAQVHLALDRIEREQAYRPPDPRTGV